MVVTHDVSHLTYEYEDKERTSVGVRIVEGPHWNQKIEVP